MKNKINVKYLYYLKVTNDREYSINRCLAKNISKKNTVKYFNCCFISGVII